MGIRFCSNYTTGVEGGNHFLNTIVTPHQLAGVLVNRCEVDASKTLELFVVE